MPNIGEAIEICDYLIEAHLRNSAGIRDKVKDWHHAPKDLGMVIAEVHEDVAKCIFAIKKRIQPNCKHPKKMRDKCKGVEYCMECNSDIQ